MIAEIQTMPIRAYSYLRFSSTKQARGDSRRRQSVTNGEATLDRGGMAEFAARVCAKENAILDDSLVFEDHGVSAFRGRNAKVGALAEFLRLVECGRIARGSILIFENFDRMSRDRLTEALTIFLGILKAGIVIWTARPEMRVTKDNVNDLGTIILPLVEMTRAHAESVRKSDLLSAAWGNKKHLAASTGRPLTGACPPWLTIAAEKYVIDEDKAATVKRLHQLAQDGVGVTLIARQLGDLGVPALGRSGKWNHPFIWQLLKSRAVFGEFQPMKRTADGKRVADGPVLKDYFPPILTEEEWYATQTALRGRHERPGRRGEGEVNLFTGILYEAASRDRMAATANNTAGKRYVYLVRYDRPKGGVRINYHDFEAGVVRCLKELHVEEVAPGGIGDIERRLEEAEKRVTFLANRVQEFKAASLDDESQDAGTALEMIDAAKAKLKEATATRDLLLRESYTGRGQTLGEVKSLLVEMEGAEGEKRLQLRRRVKARLRSLVEEIWVLVQRVDQQKQILHVQLYFRGGVRRDPLVIWPPPRSPRHPALPEGFAAWNFSGCDFRAGDLVPRG